MKKQICPACNGDGYVSQMACCWDYESVNKGSCCGNGIREDVPCECCRGEGFIIEQDESDVDYLEYKSEIK